MLASLHLWSIWWQFRWRPFCIMWGMVERGELPRAQAGGRPQHLLVTMLGDYWFERREHLPSAALVDLLAEFDISEAGARAALSRLARRGLLESSKRGRHTAYG